MHPSTGTLLALALLAVALAGCTTAPTEDGTTFTVPALRTGESVTYDQSFAGEKTYTLAVGPRVTWEDRWGRDRPVVRVAAEGFFPAFDEEDVLDFVGVDLGTRQPIQLNYTTEDGSLWSAHYLKRGGSWLLLGAPFLALPVSGVELRMGEPVHRTVHGVPVTFTYEGSSEGLHALRVAWTVERAPGPEGPWTEKGTVYRLFLGPGSAFPEQAEVVVGDDTLPALRATAREAGSEPVRWAAAPGDGAPSPPPAPRPWTLHPPDGEDPVAFPMAKAVEEARSREEGVDDYLRDHPEAYLVQAGYQEDIEPNSSVGEATWELTFGATGATAGVHVEVTKTQLVATDTYEVRTFEEEDFGHPLGDRDLLPPQMITVSAARRLAERYLAHEVTALSFALMGVPTELSRPPGEEGFYSAPGDVVWKVSHGEGDLLQPGTTVQRDVTFSAWSGEKVADKRFTVQMG